MLNGEEWVGFASEHMEFRPGRAAEIRKRQNAIQVLETELAGQIRTKDDYFEAMLEHVQPKNTLQKELALKIINTSPENPYDAWRTMYNQARYDKDVNKVYELENMRSRIIELSKQIDLDSD